MRSSKRANGEGSLYQRSDGRWVGAAYVSTTDGKRKRIHVQGQSRAEVAARLRERQQMESDGIRTATHNLNVAQYLSQWLEGMQTNIKPRTYETYESLIRLYLIPGLGKIKLTELSRLDFQRFIQAEHANGTTPRRLQQCQQVLRSALNDALRLEMVLKNAAQHVKLPAYRRRKIEPWTGAQIRRFLEATRGHRYYGAFLLSATYGLRRGEVLGLRWCDIDWERGEINIRQQLQRVRNVGLVETDVKTEAGVRALPMGSHLRDVLAGLAPSGEETEKTKRLVFLSKNGTPIDPNRYYRTFIKVADTLGLPRIPLHGLRHATATLLKDAGAPRRDAQLILGHSNPTTTEQIYQHSTMDARKAVLDRVEQVATGDVAADVAAETYLSTGQGTEIDAVTSGGPSGNRTQDTLLKRQSRSPDGDCPTPVVLLEQARSAQDNRGQVAAIVAADLERLAAGLESAEHSKPHASCPLDHSTEWLIRELRDRIQVASQDQEGRGDLAA